MGGRGRGEAVMNLRGEEAGGRLDWLYVTTNLNTRGKRARFEGGHSFILYKSFDSRKRSVQTA